MAFAQSDFLSDILPWLVLAVGIVLIGGVVARGFAVYRDRKRAQSQSTKDVQKQQQPKLLQIRGDYLVLACNVSYEVGENGQLKAGAYEVKSAVENEDKLYVRVNGPVKVYDSGSVIQLCDGDTFCPISGDVLIKPILSGENL